MRIVVCSSKSWFKLNPLIGDTHVVKYFQSKDELSIETLDQFKPDLVFFPHWNWIVGNEIFESYTCIVFHTAPLPFGRGGSPIQNLIKALDPPTVKNNNKGCIIPIVLGTSLKLNRVKQVENKKPYIIIDLETVNIAGQPE